MGFQIEWATNDDGEAIRALLAADGWHILGADWSDIKGYWLVARDGKRVIACIQVAFAKPIARLEFMTIDKGLTGLSRDRVAARMLRAAIGVCEVRGACLVAGLVPYLNDYSDVLLQRGGQVINEGYLVVGSLKHGRIKQHDGHEDHSDSGRDRVR